MNTESQTAAILAHLQDGKAITPLEALTLFNCMRLSGRVLDLRKAGHPIETELVKRGRKRVAQYRLRRLG